MVVLNRLCVVAAIGSLAFAGDARAAGFQINEHDASAMGRANAVSATIDNPSAIYYNPAGLTATEGTQFEVGATMISPHGEYKGVGNPFLNPSGKEVSQAASSQFIPVPHAYISRALSPKAFVGLGFYLPYGLRIEWEDPNFVGRNVSEESELRTFFITPSIALKLSDWLSVGAGVSLVPATLYLKRAIAATDNGQLLFPASTYGQEGFVELSASAFGVGANAGFQLTLMEKLKIGFCFRSAVDLAFTGSAKFSLPAGVPTEVAAQFPDGPVDGGVSLPHAFDIGIGWKDGPLTAELGTQITLWHTFEEQRINLARGKPVAADVSARHWSDAVLVKAGAQYTVNKAAFRLGLGYDISPAPSDTIDPTLPDANRFFATVGAGYNFGPARLDLSYMALLTAERTIDTSITFAKGTYTSGLTNLISLTLGAKL